MQNIRSHNGIPRRPALARAATQRYIGAQKTRSKDRRCSTVFEGHHCGCSFLQIGSYFSLHLIFSKTSDQNSSFFKSVFLLYMGFCFPL